MDTMPITPALWKMNVAASFSKASAFYETAAFAQTVAADFLEDLIKQHVCGEGNLLELGVGTGLLTRRLLHQFPGTLVTAVDLSADMLHRLHASLPKEEEHRVDLRQQDMDLLDEQQKYFLVCSSFALHWSTNPLLLLTRTSRFVTPGGFVAHALPLRGSLRSLSEAGYLRPIPQISLSMDELIQYLPQTDIIYAKTHEIVHTFSNPLSALQHIKSFGGCCGSPSRKTLLSVRKHPYPISCEWSVGYLIARKQ